MLCFDCRIIFNCIAIVVSLICCVHTNVYGDIVGGEVVREADPVKSSTAAMFSPSPTGKGGSLCTVSILDKNIAITAAHCLSPATQSVVRRRSKKGTPVLVFGRDINSNKAVARPITGYRVNQKWRKSGGLGMDEGDVAIVKFSGGLPRGARPVSLLESDKSLKKGKTTILAGYGISEALNHSGAGVMRKTRVKILDPRFGRSEMILDQSHGSGACHGDSGGPAYVRQGRKIVLAGITNRGYPPHSPDDCAHQVVYTKVSSYRKWIQRERKALARTGSKAERRFKKVRQNRRSH